MGDDIFKTAVDIARAHGKVLLRRPVDAPDNDPRRCPVGGVGAFHEFNGADGEFDVECQYCRASVWTVLAKLSDHVDRLLAGRR